MRQLYLKQGGSDPSILAQMSDMEIEARDMSNKKNKSKKSKGSLHLNVFRYQCKFQSCFTAETFHSIDSFRLLHVCTN